MPSLGTDFLLAKPAQSLFAMNDPCICMLIDDDAEEHEFFDIIVKMTALPVECVFTSSCQEAIAMAESSASKKFNYIIFDWMLLDKIGLGCSRDLTQVSAFGPSQFIIYSMMPPPEEVLKSFLLKNAVFLEKDPSFESAVHKFKELIVI
jgi:hypothetical protein